jgi:sarcosine oxidase
MRVAVVGCGAVGAATTRALAGEGHDVLALDRFGVPNGVGSSHGRSRIFRLAYHEGETYVPLLRRSLAAWRALDRARDLPGALFRRTGSLAVGAPNSRVVAGARETCAAHGIDHEVLSGRALGDRFPAWDLGDRYRAVFQPDGGLLDPERCVTALVSSARAAGATVRGNVRVETVCETADGVRVESTDGVHDVDRAVVAAGPWTAGLVPDVADLLTVRRHVHCRVGTPDPSSVAPDAFPVFVLDALDGRHLYGLPAHRVPGVKVGRTDTDRAVETPHPLDPPAPEESESVERFVDESLGGSTGVLAAAACPITDSPDGDYVVDRAPGSDRVVVAAGMSGHGFKTAPGVGDLAASLAVGADPPVDPSPFRVSRF